MSSVVASTSLEDILRIVARVGLAFLYFQENVSECVQHQVSLINKYETTIFSLFFLPPFDIDSKMLYPLICDKYLCSTRAQDH